MIHNTNVTSSQRRLLPRHAAGPRAAGEVRALPDAALRDRDLKYITRINNYY